MPVTKVLYGQALSDLCNEENLFIAADLNGIGITDVLTAGITITLPEEETKSPERETTNRVTRELAQRAIAGQTWTDISIQELGDEGRIFELCDLNGVGITDELIPGTVLATPSAAIDNTSIVKVLRERRPSSLQYGTGNPAEEGIEFWAIEIDFIVS